MLAHPAHPAQQHRFAIQHPGRCAGNALRCGQLSNGVWGFYRWIVPADVASGTSANGTLRFEHDVGPFELGRYDAVAPIARVRDADTGALLFDGAAGRQAGSCRRRTAACSSRWTIASSRRSSGSIL